MTHHTTPDGIAYVRTPDERFVGLDDFPYEPKYGSVDGLRMAYIDEGPEDAHPVVLLHGEPSWSYLYRRMIPTLLDAGYRVLAPDLIGFGRSDKPTDPGYYTYAQHVANIEFYGRLQSTCMAASTADSLARFIAWRELAGEGGRKGKERAPCTAGSPRLVFRTNSTLHAHAMAFKSSHPPRL